MRFIIGFIIGLGAGYVFMAAVGEQDASELLKSLQRQARREDPLP